LLLAAYVSKKIAGKIGAALLSALCQSSSVPQKIFILNTSEELVIAGKQANKQVKKTEPLDTKEN